MGFLFNVPMCLLLPASELRVVLVETYCMVMQPYLCIRTYGDDVTLMSQNDSSLQPGNTRGSCSSVIDGTVSEAIDVPRQHIRNCRRRSVGNDVSKAPRESGHRVLRHNITALLPESLKGTAVIYTERSPTASATLHCNKHSPYAGTNNQHVSEEDKNTPHHIRDITITQHHHDSQQKLDKGPSPQRHSIIPSLIH